MHKMKFYEHDPIMVAHKHGLFEIVWIVQHELEIEATFPCEVCGAKGYVSLKTKTEDGLIVDRSEECYYCRGEKVRHDRHHDFTVVGPCQVYAYEVNAWPKEPGKDLDPAKPGDDKDYYLYPSYRVHAPEGYKKDGSYAREGELESLHPKGDEIFKSEAEARADAERRNEEARQKDKADCAKG